MLIARKVLPGRIIDELMHNDRIVAGSIKSRRKLPKDL